MSKRRKNRPLPMERLPQGSYDPQRFASNEQRIFILERDLYACRYCGNHLTNETANMDHIWPWRRGGRTIVENLVTCCRWCNRKKKNKGSIVPAKPGHPTDPFKRLKHEERLIASQLRRESRISHAVQSHRASVNGVSVVSTK